MTTPDDTRAELVAALHLTKEAAEAALRDSLPRLTAEGERFFDALDGEAKAWQRGRQQLAAELAAEFRKMQRAFEDEADETQSDLSDGLAQGYEHCAQICEGMLPPDARPAPSPVRQTVVVDTGAELARLQRLLRSLNQQVLEARLDERERQRRARREELGE